MLAVTGRGAYQGDQCTEAGGKHRRVPGFLACGAVQIKGVGSDLHFGQVIWLITPDVESLAAHILWMGIGDGRPCKDRWIPIENLGHTGLATAQDIVRLPAVGIEYEPPTRKGFCGWAGIPEVDDDISIDVDTALRDG